MHYINTFVNFVLNMYFTQSRCVLIFTDAQHTLHLNFSVPIVAINIDEHGKFNHGVVFNYYGCQGVLIYNSMPAETIQEFEKAIRYDTLERFNTRRYLVVVEEDNLQMSNSEYPNKIFDLQELEYIADFLFVIHSKVNQNFVEDLTLQTMNSSEDMTRTMSDDYKFDLYTHKFVGLHKSDTQEIVYMDTWYFTQNFNTINTTMNLYPDKLHNGEGREFRIATFTYKPYSVPEFDDGTELQIAIEFSRQYNLTPFYVIDEEGEWGEIYDNWTGYGILGNVMEDHGDIGLAALYTWAHEYLFLDLSKPVVRTGITCLTPAPHLAAGWLVPLFSFTYEMWIAVGVTFLVCSVVLTLLDYYNQDKDDPKWRSSTVLAQESVLDTASIFLLQAFNRFGHAAISKNFLHGCMFLYSLLIASSYASGLASSLTVPRYVGAINTVQDLVDSGIQWGATSIAWIMSIMDAEEYNYQVLVERFVKTDGPRLKKYNNKRFAFSIERLPAGQFAIGEYITEEGVSALKIMHEDLYMEQCVLMTKKSSIWMPLIDNFILELAQTGIPGVWEYRVATKHLNPKIQKAVQFAAHHTESSNTPVKLHWGHVQGTFALLTIGLIAAFICFVGEWIHKLKTNNIDRGLYITSY